MSDEDEASESCIYDCSNCIYIEELHNEYIKELEEMMKNNQSNYEKHTRQLKWRVEELELQVIKLKGEIPTICSQHENGQCIINFTFSKE